MMTFAFECIQLWLGLRNSIDYNHESMTMIDLVVVTLSPFPPIAVRWKNKCSVSASNRDDKEERTKNG